MKIITAGHCYELENFEDPSKPGQVLQFIQKQAVYDCVSGQDPVPSGKLVTVHDGTTNEEVLAMLIDRLGCLNAKFPCRDNSIAITHLEDALLRLEKRTNDRKKRGVEGSHQK